MISCHKLVSELDHFFSEASEKINQEIISNHKRDYQVQFNAVCNSTKELRLLRCKAHRIMPGFYDQVASQHTLYYEICCCDNVVVLSLKGGQLVTEKEIVDAVFERCLEAAESVDPEWTFSAGFYDRRDVVADAIYNAWKMFQEKHPVYANKVRIFVETADDCECGARQMVFSAQYKK